MKTKWNWALIGPGRFAGEFAEELKDVDRAGLHCVASRSRQKADEFAREFGFEKSYGDYQSVFEDDQVDIVYVVVPHVFHFEITAASLRAGKAVLCEKPLTPCAEETAKLINIAEQSGTFLMEAMKTGFLPAIQQAKKWIDSGKIGTPKIARADFCFQGSTDPNDRLMNPDLAGGAVLDVGIYPLYLARYLLGEVSDLQAVGSITETGVEDSATMIAKHESGASSAMTCSFRTEEAMDAVILGTDGEIRIPIFHAASKVELYRDGKLVDSFEDTIGGMVRAEIDAVHGSLDQGLIQNPLHSHQDSIRLAEMMDQVRPMISAT